MFGGGYGSGRLLDLVDYDTIASRPKILLGFSDTTALSLAVYARARLVSFSGAVTDLDLGRDEPDELTQGSLWRAVTSTDALGELSIESGELETIRAGRAEGPLFPATLALLCSLIGTPYMPDLEGAILLLEDVDEYPYRLDRMLNQLRLAGILGKLAALVLGQFRDCFTAEETGRSPSLREMINELTSDIDIPSSAAFPTDTLPDGSCSLSELLPDSTPRPPRCGSWSRRSLTRPVESARLLARSCRHIGGRAISSC